MSLPKTKVTSDERAQVLAAMAVVDANPLWRAFNLLMEVEGARADMTAMAPGLCDSDRQYACGMAAGIRELRNQITGARNEALKTSS